MILIIVAAAVLGLSIYLFLRDWTTSWPRWVFGVNMLLLCVLLVLFGLKYSVKIPQAKASRRTVVVLVDISGSTGIDPEKFKTMADKAWQEHSVEVVPFSSELKGPAGAEATALTGSLNGALAYLEEKYEDDEIAGFVLVTDGNETEKISRLNKPAMIAGNFPHNTIYLTGKRSEVSFDKSVSFIKAPRFVPQYKKETVVFSVSVVGARLTGVPVEIRVNGSIVGSVFVQLKDGYGEGTYDLVLKKPGMVLLEASVAVDSRETIQENNRDNSVVEGIIKGFRVLHISGHPTVDTTFIRRGLQNIPGVDMISFYILRGLEQQDIPGSGELSLIPFPTDQLFRTELENFDLIIINDFSFKRFLSSLYINNIASFVRSGGALLILGGPESFLTVDFENNIMGSVLPVTPVKGSSWNNGRYRAAPLDIAEMTSMAQLTGTGNFSFQGLNRVQVKPWSTVFFRTSGGEPLITGGFVGKGRVLSVLTDSFWRFSYNGKMRNEVALRSLVRYVLGISSMPVRIFGRTIGFEKQFIKNRFPNVSAQIGFIRPDGTTEKEVVIIPGEPYQLGESVSRLLAVKIKNKDALVDSYTLVNYNDRTGNEYTYVPLGRRFLEGFSDTGDGMFIPTAADAIADSLSKVELRDPVVVLEKQQVENPIYMSKLVLLLFLYLLLSSFFIKSKYIS